MPKQSRWLVDAMLRVWASGVADGSRTGRGSQATPKSTAGASNRKDYERESFGLQRWTLRLTALGIAIASVIGFFTYKLAYQTFEHQVDPGLPKVVVNFQLIVEELCSGYEGSARKMLSGDYVKEIPGNAGTKIAYDKDGNYFYITKDGIKKPFKVSDIFNDYHLYCGIYFPRDGSKLGDYLGVIKAKKLKLRFFSDDKNEKPNEHLINMGDLLKEKEIKELTVNVGKGHCADISVRIVEYLHDNSKVDMTAENVSWDLLDSNKK